MPAPNEPSYRHEPGTNHYFRVVMRIRHAEPVFTSASFIAHLADRIRWIGSPVRAGLVASGARAWKGQRIDEAWTTDADDESRILGATAGATWGTLVLPVVGTAVGGLVGYLASRFATNTDPVSPQWWAGLEGEVQVYQGGITNEELLRAIARAFADSVTWGYRDGTVNASNLPTHGGDLLRRMLDGSPDPHGVYARARVIVTRSGSNDGPVDTSHPSPDQPGGNRPAPVRQPAASQTRWALPAVVGATALVTLGAVVAYRTAGGGS